MRIAGSGEGRSRSPWSRNRLGIDSDGLNEEGKPHDPFGWRGKFSLESQVSTVSIGRNRNLACEQAAAEFIAYRDDHDWYASDRLCHQLASGTGGCWEPTDDGFRKDGTQPNQPPGDPGGGPGPTHHFFLRFSGFFTGTK